MRSGYPFTGNKPIGVIIRRSANKISKESPRSLSVDTPVTHHNTISSNDSSKIPGQIKTIIKSHREKVDEQVFYNSDVYAKYQKPKENITYEQAESFLAIKQDKKYVNQTPVTHTTRMTKQLQSIEEEGNYYIKNIHGQFDLNKFRQMYDTHKIMSESFGVNEIELLQSMRSYINIACKYNVDDTSHMKFVSYKRQIMRQVFAKQRQAIIVISQVVAIKKYDKMKNYCSNLLNYTFQSYLICLNILTEEQNSYVQKLIKDANKEHLLGKGFEQLRTMNDMISSLIVKITKIADPLFADQFFKIIDNYSSNSVKSLLYALLTFFAFYINAIKAAQTIPFLTVAPGPFIIESTTNQYTLVIDFMRVFLDHSIPKKNRKRKEQFAVRPYSAYFLKQMAKYYEIVSFCDYMPIQCNKIITKIDEFSVIKHRLYKYHIDHEKNRKQAEKIGRDLSKLLILDTVQDKLNLNLMPISSWKGQQSNAQLAQICPLLATVVVKNLSVVDSLAKIRAAMNVNSSLGLKYINCGLNL